MYGLLKLLEKLIGLFAKNATTVQVETPKIPETVTTTSNIPYSDIEYKNNSNRLKEEFVELGQRNSDLFNLICYLNTFCQFHYNKHIIITMVYRTQEEQDNIYQTDPKYLAKKFKSPHQFYHAVDLRSSIFTKEEIDKITKY